MSENDMIRRGDVLAIVFPDACSEARKGALCLHPSCENVRYSPILDAIRALPADPVAEAAGKLAEATDAMEDECCGAGISKYLAANGWTDSEAAFNRMLSALDAYRAAVAARAKETR